MKEYLSIKEACNDFGISKASMYRLIKAKVLNKYQLGTLAKRTFVMRDEILKAFKKG